MGKISLDMSMSLDGFVSGPNGEDSGLHDWYFAPTEKDTFVIDELLQGIGAMIIGRKLLGDSPDGFDTPYKAPHFVLTHQARPTVEKSGVPFRFMADGMGSSLAQAQAVGCQIKMLPNTACTRLVGLAAFSSSICGLRLVPSK